VLPARLPAAGALRYRVTEKGALARASGPEKEILERLSSGEAVRASELPGSARQDVLRDLEARGWIPARSPDPPRRPRSGVGGARPPPAPGRGREPPARGRRGPGVLAWLDALGRPALAGETRLATGAGPAVLRDLASRGLVRSFEQGSRSPAAAPPP